MKITCPRCQATLKVVAADPGTVHTCPKCQAQFRTGGASTPAGGAASSSPAAKATDSLDDWFDSPAVVAPAPAPQVPAPAAAAPRTPAPRTPAPGTPAPVRATPKSTPGSPAGPSPQPIPVSPVPPFSPASQGSPRRQNPAGTPTHQAPPEKLPRDKLEAVSPWLNQGNSGPRPELPPLSLDDMGGEEDAQGARPSPEMKVPPPNGPGGATLPPLAVEAGEYRFSLSCPVCATRMDFVSSQIGEEAQCPDCLTTFAIPVPGPHVERTSLNDPRFQAPENLSLEATADQTKRIDTPDAIKQRAESLLQRAQEEMRAERRDAREHVLSDSATRSLFSFFIAPNTVVRMVVLTIFGAVAWGLMSFSAANVMGSSSGVYSLLSLGVGVPVLICWLLVMAAHSLAILSATSARVGEVDDWPGANAFDWIGGAVQVAWAAVMAAVPGFFVAFFLDIFGLPTWVASLLLPASLIAFFPIVLLSILHEQSWTAVFSGEILEGIRRVSHVSTTFYQGSTLLGIVGWMAAWLVWFGQPFLAIPQAAVLVVVAFLYFRLLGWLANSITLEDEDEIVA